MMSVHWAKADIRLRALDPILTLDYVRSKPTVGGKSLALIGAGPAGLLRSQKTGIKYKKPSYSGLGGESSAWICCRVSRAIDPRFCKPKVGSSILSTGTTNNHCGTATYCIFGCSDFGSKRSLKSRFGSIFWSNCDHWGTPANLPRQPR